MVNSTQILTVSYGTFSCTLEGFDDPFNTMKSIAEYFRDLAADDRYFGAEPPQPDAEMLHRIAEREVNRRVEARVADDGLVLRQIGPEATSGPLAEAPAPTVAAPAHTLAPQSQAAAQPEPQVVAPQASPESVADKLSRIRAAVARARAAEAEDAMVQTYEEDEPVERSGYMGSINEAFSGPAFPDMVADVDTADAPGADDDSESDRTTAQFLAEDVPEEGDIAATDAVEEASEGAETDAPADAGDATAQAEAADDDILQADEAEDAAELSQPVKAEDAAEPEDEAAAPEAVEPDTSGSDTIAAEDGTEVAAEAEVLEAAETAAEAQDVADAATSVDVDPALDAPAADAEVDALAAGPAAEDAVLQVEDAAAPESGDAPMADDAEEDIAAPSQEPLTDAPSEADVADLAALDGAAPDDVAAIEDTPAEPEVSGTEDSPEATDLEAAPTAEAADDDGADPTATSDVAAEADTPEGAVAAMLDAAEDAEAEDAETVPDAPREEAADEDTAAPAETAENDALAADASDDDPFETVAGGDHSAADMAWGDTPLDESDAIAFAEYAEDEAAAPSDEDTLAALAAALNPADEEIVDAAVPLEAVVEEAADEEADEAALQEVAGAADAAGAEDPQEASDSFDAADAAATDDPAGDDAAPSEETEAADHALDVLAAELGIDTAPAEPEAPLVLEAADAVAPEDPSADLAEPEAHDVSGEDEALMAEAPAAAGGSPLAGKSMDEIVAAIALENDIQDAVVDPSVAKPTFGTDPDTADVVADVEAFDEALPEPSAEATDATPDAIEEDVQAFAEDLAEEGDAAAEDLSDDADTYAEDIAAEAAEAAEAAALEDAAFDDDDDDDGPMPWDAVAEAEDAPLVADAEDAADAEAVAPRGRIIRLKRRDFEEAVLAGEVDSIDEAAEEDDDTLASFAQAEQDMLEDAPEDAAEIEEDAQLTADIRTMIGETSLSDADEEELLEELASVERDSKSVRADDPLAAEDAADDLLAEDEVDEAGDSDEDALNRLLTETNNKLGDSEGSRRRSAIAHLKAAVAATRADRQLKSERDKQERDAMDRYRDDLAKVVRPRRPNDPAGGRPGRGRPVADMLRDRGTPLVLVSEQRVDIPEEERRSSADPVHPRRIGSDALEAGSDVAAKAAVSFADFAKQAGAEELPDILEAAAAYATLVEGQEGVSRPQILRRAATLTGETEISREQGLQSFGMLLRTGRIRKLGQGRFGVSDDAKTAQLARASNG